MLGNTDGQGPSDDVSEAKTGEQVILFRERTLGRTALGRCGGGDSGANRPGRRAHETGAD